MPAVLLRPLPRHRGHLAPGPSPLRRSDALLTPSRAGMLQLPANTGVAHRSPRRETGQNWAWRAHVALEGPRAGIADNNTVALHASTAAEMASPASA